MACWLALIRSGMQAGALFGLTSESESMLDEGPMPRGEDCESILDYTAGNWEGL